MNTKAVAELLGISISTVQRWVKQLNVKMEKNEHGHYVFSEENIEMLKHVKSQLQKGILLQDITTENKRRGAVKSLDSEAHIVQLASKINHIEGSLRQKADSVVTYQLLQHRREMEELEKQISSLADRLVEIEECLQKDREIAVASEQNLKIGKKSTFKKPKWLRLILGNFLHIS